MKDSVICLYRQITVILILFLAISCNSEDDEFALNKGISPASIIYFKQIDNPGTQADGVSLSTFTIQINPEFDSSFHEITLSTSLGKFANGQKTDTITANAYGIAYFTLSSESTGEARITATVRSYTVSTTVDFEPALPDDILLSADRLVIDNTANITVTSQLVRDSFRGKVSDPLKVHYTVTSLAAQTNTLIFPDFSMSSQGVSTITVSNPFVLTGDFKVRAETLSASNQPLVKELIFRIQ